MRTLITLLLWFCCGLAGAVETIPNADGGQIEIHRELGCPEEAILKVTPRENHREVYLAMSRLRSGQVLLTGCARRYSNEWRIIWVEFGYDTWRYPLSVKSEPSIDWDAPRRWQPGELPPASVTLPPFPTLPNLYNPPNEHR